ncbi:MAG: hypothetical protein ALAOOOJD_00261 [bacterium]|nr:hypothetical protein [bacterium]
MANFRAFILQNSQLGDNPLELVLQRLLCVANRDFKLLQFEIGNVFFQLRLAHLLFRTAADFEQFLLLLGFGFEKFQFELLDLQLGLQIRDGFFQIDRQAFLLVLLEHDLVVEFLQRQLGRADLQFQNRLAFRQFRAEFLENFEHTRFNRTRNHLLELRHHRA